MQSIAIIGAGSWGTALALLLAEKGLEVRLWVHGKETYEKIMHYRENVFYLPGVKLPENILPTRSLSAALKGQKIILMVVPSHIFREILTQMKPYLEKDCLLISATKGIENESLLTMSGVTKDVLKEISFQYAVLSGPSFAKEVAAKLPTAVTVASADKDVAALVQRLFSTAYFRVYTHSDVLGVELGGSLKNVMAIAAGICDGLGLGANARAALITRGLVEMSRLGQRLGAHPQTFAGLSGLGDLVLTCTSTLSRNYTVGRRLGKGERITDILNSMRMVAEGVKTSKAAYRLAQREETEMPIVSKVYEILYQEKSPLDGLKELLSRTPKPEFW